MKLSQKAASHTHRVLVYGEPKSGKTQLVGELANEFELVYFDLENGYATLSKLPPSAQERIELFSIPDTKVYPIAIETLLKVFTGNEVVICEAHGKVSCPICKSGAPICLNSLQPHQILVVDSLTQLSNSCMNYLLKGKDDLYKPEWSDYRNQGQLLDKLLSQIQQAKYNVVCITHVTETELEDGRKKLVPVAGTTAFSRNTAKYFDHVVYCEMKNKSHVFASSTTYSAQALTGSRTDAVLEKSNSLLSIFRSPNTAPQTQAQKSLANLKGALNK